MRKCVLMLVGLAFLCRAEIVQAGEKPAPMPATPAATEKAAPSAQPDARVKKLLDGREIKYEVTKLGNFNVVFDLKSGRHQGALIRSGTYRYLNLDIREILSPAYKSDKPLTAETANRLLADNNEKKMGAWVVQKQADGYYAVFVTKIPADSDADSFFSALKLTLEAADEMEKELAGKDEF